MCEHISFSDLGHYFIIAYIYFSNRAFFIASPSNRFYVYVYKYINEGKCIFGLLKLKS